MTIRQHSSSSTPSNTLLPEMNIQLCNIRCGYYHPRSEASEGYDFTGVCHFSCGGGEVGSTKGRPPPPSRSQDPRSQHLPSQPGSKVTTPPPSGQGQRSQHLPPARVKGHNTSPLPGLKVTTSPPGHYAQAGGTHPTRMHSC